MAERVRVGIVGTSWWTDTLYLPSLASHPGADLTAICGRNREPAQALAAKYGIPNVYTDYRAMMTSGVLDAVVVVTPDATHYPITMAALEAGLHVMCEKPMALNADDAKQMYDAAEASGRKHLIMFTNHWIAPVNYVHRLVEDRFIGQCYHARFLLQGGSDGSYEWRFDRRYRLGALGDLSSHAIDLARWLVGDIARVSGHLATFVERPGQNGGKLDAVNDSALIGVEFQNGAHAEIAAGAVSEIGARGLDLQIALYGDAGSLELDWTLAGSDLRALRRGESEWRVRDIPVELSGVGEHPPPWDHPALGPFVNLSAGPRLFVDSIIEDRLATPNFYDGWKSQQVIDAAIASYEQGRWINIA